MPNTYTELDKVTVGTAVASVTFSSISSAYTDLVIVGSGTLATNSTLNVKFNNDASNLYSRTEIYGDGSSAASYRESTQSTQNFANWDTSGSNFIMHLQNYSNSTTFKTCLTRYNRPSSLVAANVVLYRSTTAISNIVITGGSNIAVGSTFSLYGIANADQGAAKATGGVITEDSQYWYHTFGASGAFIPKQSLTCDVLVVAGGGGGGASGGGAGGLLFHSSQSLTAISYNVTVGAGGTGNTGGGSANSTNGVNSQFAALTASVGGGWGGRTVASSGNTGGSGGGAFSNSGTVVSGSAPTSGQGNSGGSSASDRGGGGGGAGAAGGNGSGGGAGAGGVGVSTYSSWGLATTTGQNISGTVWYAGGGGSFNGTSGGSGGGGAGAGSGSGASGTVNTGGGAGGGDNFAGGAGGSGVVIVRYAK